MGTLEDTQAAVGRIRRMKGAGLALEAETVISRASAYRAELSKREERRPGPYYHEIRDLDEAILAITRVCQSADPATIWRGRTLEGQFVLVRRDGQMAVGRRGRARVEDAFVVTVDGVAVGRWLRRAAMKAGSLGDARAGRRNAAMDGDDEGTGDEALSS